MLSKIVALISFSPFPSQADVILLAEKDSSILSWLDFHTLSVLPSLSYSTIDQNGFRARSGTVFPGVATKLLLTARFAVNVKGWIMASRKRKVVADEDEDQTKIDFETSEEVDVVPTFDQLKLREELLRGVYAYGMSECKEESQIEVTPQCVVYLIVCSAGI